MAPRTRGKQSPTLVDYLGDSRVAAGGQILILAGCLTALFSRTLFGGRLAFWLLVFAAIWPSVAASIATAWSPCSLSRQIRSVIDGLAVLLRLMIWFTLGVIIVSAVAPAYLPLAGGWWLWAGFLAALALSWPFTAVARVLQCRTAIALGHGESPSLDWSVRYRRLGRSELRLALAQTVFLNPLLEEVVQRGVLVYHLGIVIASPLSTIAGGLLLFLLLHAYHGVDAMPSAVLFYAIAIALLYSPLGLVGCYGFHVGCNALFAWSVLRDRSRWIDRSVEGRGSLTEAHSL